MCVSDHLVDDFAKIVNYSTFSVRVRQVFSPSNSCRFSNSDFTASL